MKRFNKDYTLRLNNFNLKKIKSIKSELSGQSSHTTTMDQSVINWAQKLCYTLLRVFMLKEKDISHFVMDIFLIQMTEIELSFLFR